MRLLDVTSDPRISAMMELIGLLGRAAEPREVLEELVGGMLRPENPRAYGEISTAGQEPGGYVIQRLRTGRGVTLYPLPPGRDVDQVKAGSGGFLGQMIRTPLPKIAHHLELGGDPVLPGEMADYHSAMAMPVFIDQAARNWVVLFDARPEGFTVDDLEELIVRTTLVSTAINNFTIARQLFAANLKIQEEIAQIAEIQQALLPGELPEIPGLRVAASYESLRQAGGDLYDFLPLGERAAQHEPAGQERWAILIGDVSGHGAGAATVMAMVHSILHAYPQMPAGPAEVLTHVNRHLCAKRIGRVFATAFLGFYEPATRSLVYARAGHSPPLLLDGRRQGRPVYLDAVGGLPIGVDGDAAFAESTVRLAPGQLLILYTDGVTDAKSPRGEFFDTSGLEAALTDNASDAASAVRRINQAILEHAGGRPAADDRTIVAIEVCE